MEHLRLNSHGVLYSIQNTLSRKNTVIFITTFAVIRISVGSSTIYYGFSNQVTFPRVAIWTCVNSLLATLKTLKLLSSIDITLFPFEWGNTKLEQLKLDLASVPHSTFTIKNSETDIDKSFGKGSSSRIDSEHDSILNAFCIFYLQYLFWCS